MKVIKWSIEYWSMVEFSKGAFNHWLQVLINGDYKE